nr:MAG TPA: hypothetical protein [Bacteriophage sp.]
MTNVFCPTSLFSSNWESIFTISNKFQCKYNDCFLKINI